MSSLLPIRSEPSTGEDEPRVVDLEGEDADQVFSALSSDTARKIVATLHEEPRTQSEISDALDTTVQNVRYHLDKLEEAGLVEVVDTWYSSRGNEMAVYAPADGALIVSGNEQEASRLRTALSRLVGGVAVVGLASLFVQYLFGQGLAMVGGGGGDAGGIESGGDGGDGGAGPSVAEAPAESTQRAMDAATNGTNRTVTETVQVTATETAADAAAAGAAGLPPGLLFFLGGLSVLVVVVAVAYYGGR